LSSAQYEADNPWAVTVQVLGSDIPASLTDIPTGRTLIVTSVNMANQKVTCQLQGGLNGSAVNYPFGSGISDTGLDWPLDSTATPSVLCAGGSATPVTVAGYLS
jgi:hypothetical protein